MNAYIPKQRDIVWLNFSPSSGREIKKRRPGIVVSNTHFNKLTGFCLICPITTSDRQYPSVVKLDDQHYSVEGSILTHQIRSLDYGSREIAYTDKLSSVKWIETIEKIGMIF